MAVCLLSAAASPHQSTRARPIGPLDSALNGRRQIPGIADRPFAVHAIAFGDGSVIDIGFGQSSADIRLIHAAVILVALDLEIHALLVVGAIVVHQTQQRDLVVRMVQRSVR